MAKDNEETQGVKLLQASERAGYEIYIPGECLKPGSKVWTEEQRKVGIWLKMVYLTPSEEEKALGEAQRAGNVAAVAMTQVRVSIHEQADNVPVKDEVDGEEVLRNEPGPFRRVPSIELRPLWAELGPQGRSFAMSAFNMANSPSDEARAAAMASFRVTG